MSEPQPLRDQVALITDWWHSIDLGSGVVTPGIKTPEMLRAELESLRLPDLRGKSVLDIGAWDGFYSFEAERRGARRVVSLDHFVWSIDRHVAGRMHYRWHQERLKPIPYEETESWQPDLLPGKRGYDLAHRALGSRAVPVVADFMKAELGETFDVVFFLGVVYHMRHPLLSLEKVRSFLKEGGVAIIESEAMEIRGQEGRPLIEFIERDELGGYDFTNWHSFNQKALEGMCRAAGFSRVEVVQGPPPGVPVPSSFLDKARRVAGNALRDIGRKDPLPDITRYRIVLHAWA
jgi:tRNA (mo5U34)-methyltransferase